MDTFAYCLIRHPLTWTIALNVVALAAFVASPFGSDYPVAVLGIQAFMLIPMLVPSCRLVWVTPLCPNNMAQAMFWIQLVLLPLLIGYGGVSQSTLPRIPGADALNMVMGLHVLAYIAFCVTYHYFHERRTVVEVHSGRPRVTQMPKAPYGLIVPFFVAGSIGFVLAFGSIDGYLDFISSPVQQKEREQEATTPARAASTFLRPFLGFSLVLAWSAWTERLSCRAAIAATGLLLLSLVFANFSYNRGYLLAPILGALAAYSQHVRRISFVTLTLAGTLIMSAALAFGSYRSTEQRITELSADDLQETIGDDNHLITFVQIYGGAPQITAFLTEELGRDNTFYFGKTIVPSLLHPIPVLGKPFRANSSMTILNMLIYDDPEIIDQNMTYDAELYINFHVAGVVAGYALLGWMVAALQWRFAASGCPIESYIWFLFAFWLVFPGSLVVLSQIAFYFFWPSYLYLIVKRFGKRAGS